MQQNRLRNQLDGRRKRLFNRLRTRHIHGPKRFDLLPDEICGILLGRNIGYYIPEFMAHHRALGMKYLVYMDNGSDDDSVALMQAQENVIILSNTLNFRDYQRHMRMHVASAYASGGWRLALDADEILRYPGDARIDLPELTRRLAARGQSGLLAQMLEMVPEGPLEAADALPYADARQQFRHYSLDAITETPYHDESISFHYHLARNSLADPRVAFLYGGLRRSLFAEDCCLSKHVLFRPGPDVVPLPNPHVTSGLHMADFTAVLLHYKFAGGFLEREKRRQAEKRLAHNETDLRLARFARDPDMSLSVEGMRRDPTPEGLLEEGFLYASDAAREMLEL